MIKIFQKITKQFRSLLELSHFRPKTNFANSRFSRIQKYLSKKTRYNVARRRLALAPMNAPTKVKSASSPTTQIPMLPHSASTPAARSTPSIGMHPKSKARAQNLNHHEPHKLQSRSPDKLVEKPTEKEKPAYKLSDKPFQPSAHEQIVEKPTDRLGAKHVPKFSPNKSTAKSSPTSKLSWADKDADAIAKALNKKIRSVVKELPMVKQIFQDMYVNLLVERCFEKMKEKGIQIYRHVDVNCPDLNGDANDSDSGSIFESESLRDATTNTDTDENNHIISTGNVPSYTPTFHKTSSQCLLAQQNAKMYELIADNMRAFEMRIEGIEECIRTLHKTVVTLAKVQESHSQQQLYAPHQQLPIGIVVQPMKPEFDPTLLLKRPFPLQ